MKHKTKSGVYCIINKINNKIYIGSSINIQERIYNHKTHLNKNIHCNKYLQSSYNKYGKDNFEFDILDLCSPDIMHSIEKYWINITNSCNKNFGYNLCPNPTKGTLGYKYTEQQKENIKNSIKGKRKGILNPNYGKKSPKHVIEASINATAKAVAQINKNTDEVIKIFRSIEEAERFIGKSSTHISAVCNNKKNRNNYPMLTAYGYKWKFI